MHLLTVRKYLKQSLTQVVAALLLDYGLHACDLIRLINQGFQF